MGLAIKTRWIAYGQFIYPGINFTCNGAITSWSVLAREFTRPDDVLYPDLQLWRPTGGEGVYNKVGNLTMSGGNMKDNDIYKFQSPLTFQTGDILGIFQPHRTKSHLIIQLQQDIGSVSFYRSANSAVEPPFTSLNVSEDGKFYDYPLVSVVTGKFAHA